MLINRGQLLSGLLLSGVSLSAQMASRGVKPTARGKFSGLPFNSKLTDIAIQAGLDQPIIYGDIDKNDYILEADGCGIAFIDFDNDGWLDIFVLGGNSDCVHDAGRLGVRKSTWATSFSARHSTAPHQARRSTRRPRENRLAYVPAFLFHFVTQYGSRHQGAARITEALDCAQHDECLHAGGLGTEEGCKQRSCRSAFRAGSFYAL